MKYTAPVLFVCLISPVFSEEPKLLLKPSAFPTLVNPNCSHCADEAKARVKELKPDDKVLAWTRGKYDGGAIPFRFFLNPYRVISDSYGTFVHDPDAGFARAFKASYDFQFAGWRNGVAVVKHKDGTLFSGLSGKAFDGPRKGERLERWPTIIADWAWVMAEYPNGVAYKMFEKYQPVEADPKPNPDSVSTRGPADPRLPAEEMVLGIDRPNDMSKPRAFPLKRLAGIKGDQALILDKFECCVEIAVLWNAPTRTATAYEPVAERREAAKQLGEEGKALEEKTVDLAVDPQKGKAAWLDRKSGSRFDLAGRCVEGSLKGWTLRPLDSVMVKWFAWAAEFPDTTLHADKKPPAPAKGDPGKTDAAIKEISGTAEFLRAVPKKNAELKGLDLAKRTVFLLVDGEKESREWTLTPEAEIKVAGWWGRLDDLKVGERVWVWFATDRKRQPTDIFMIADSISEKAIRGLPTEGLEELRGIQRKKLADRWLARGLPGTLGTVHAYSGEADVLLDHEGMAWGRTLKAGEKVKLQADPPIDAVVKTAAPAHERTLVRLVINGLDIAELRAGQRVHLLIAKPELSEDSYPPYIDSKRPKSEQIEWFLANMYCVCGVKGNTCTGQFYTLASCNPNGCAAPNATRTIIGNMIDKGMVNRAIYDELMKERGKGMTQPHLLP